MKQWNKQKVIQTIRRLQRKKQPLNSWHIQRFHSSLYNSALKYCGNWPKAIVAAGIAYNKVRKKRECPKWSKEIVVQTIKKLHRAGEKINSNHIQQNNHPLYGAAYKYWGGWQQAIEAAGFDYCEDVRLHEKTDWTDQLILKKIRSRKCRRLLLNGSIVNVEDHNLYRAAIRHFGKGGWRKALKLAGIDPDSVQDLKTIWTEKKVIRDIQRLFRERFPLYGYFLQRNGYHNLFAGGVKVFGSWKKAIEAAGLDYGSVRGCRSWTKQKVLSEIRRIAKAHIPLSSKFIHLDYDGGLFAQGIRHFGDWGSAVEAAGLDYRTYLQVWSYKAWLRRLDQQQSDTIQVQAREFATERRKKK